MDHIWTCGTNRELRISTMVFHLVFYLCVIAMWVWSVGGQEGRSLGTTPKTVNFENLICYPARRNRGLGEVYQMSAIGTKQTLMD